MNWLGDLIQTEITSNDTVLDLGCGIMSTTDCLKCKSVLGVDVWERYLEHIKDRYQTAMIPMEETDRFLNKSYDVVLCLDVLEHLEKNFALKIIDECKRIARKKVIIYTPSVHKDNSSAEKDAWGLGECPYQKHISVVDSNDFTSRGFRVKDPMKDNSHYAVCEVRNNGL